MSFKSLIFLDLSMPEIMTNGLECCYFDKIDSGRTFFELWLEKARHLVGKEDKILAVVHPKLWNLVAKFFIERPEIQVVPFPEETQGLDDNPKKFLNSRKWAHQNMGGGIFDTCIYDELVKVGLVQEISRQIEVEQLLYLHPEMPFFDVAYAKQLLMLGFKIKEHNNLPLLYRQTGIGFSPVLFTHYGMESLKKNIWVIAHQLGTETSGAGWGSYRIAMNVPRVLAIDDRRERVLLRSKRDTKKLKALASFFSEEDLLNAGAKDFLAMLDAHPELRLEDEPRETVFGNEDQKMQMSDLELLERCRIELAEREDALVSIYASTELLLNDGLKNWKAKARPYGLHVFVEWSEELDKELEKVFAEVELDVLEVDMTYAIEKMGADAMKAKASDFRTRLGKLQVNVCTMFSVKKTLNNWREAIKIYEWRRDNSTYINLRAGHLKPHETGEQGDLFYYRTRERYPCEKMLFQQSIQSGGKIPMCFVSEKEGTEELGTKSLKELWNEKTGLRKKMLNAPFEVHEVCKNCRHWSYC